MTQAIVVTGTDTDVGKTVFAAGLVAVTAGVVSGAADRAGRTSSASLAHRDASRS